MPTIGHSEKHFTGSATVRDVVIGMADGLTVPFALAAGLSAAMTTTDLVVTAGLAEIVAGAIAMGLGGYLAAKTDAEHYAAEERRERYEIAHMREHEIAEIRDIFAGYGLSGAPLESVVGAVTAEPKRWLDFMMRFELGLERPSPRRAKVSAATIGGSYLIGGLVPLIPYMSASDIHAALLWSVATTAAALLVFGWVKGRFTGTRPLKSGMQTLLVGGLAAGAAYGFVQLFSA